MEYLRGIDREQRELSPPSLDEVVAENNPVRVIDAFVDGLVAAEIGFKREAPAWTGRRGYDPKDLLKLYIYGYLNRVRSSRRMMRECVRNVEVMWLIHRLTPDFRTIADFRKDNRLAIRNAFRAFVKVLDEMKLFRKELFAVDGTKVRANNSIKKSFTPELLEKKLAYLAQQEKQLEAYLNGMDEADARERTLPLDIPKEKAPEKLKEVRARAAKYRGYQARMKETGETQILETDSECRTLHSKDGLHPAYNVQTAVDGGSHLVAEFMVTTANTDQNLLSEVAEQTKQAMGLETIRVVADKGYESREDIEKCLLNGVAPDVGFKYDKEERIFTLEHVPIDIPEEKRASAKPEDILDCLRAGVLPRCYEGTNIQVEAQYRGAVSCFIRHEDGTVTCPMGRQLFKHADKKYGTVYGSQEACRTCPNRCTDSKNAKTVSIGYNSTYVPVIMYGDPKYPLQQLPDVAQNSPYNHFGKWKHAQSKVKLTIRRDIHKQQLRKELSEHPFGTVKWADGAHYFLCRGKEKVTAETALSFLAYDFRRAIRLTTPNPGDVPGILMFLRAKNRAKRAG